MTNRTTIALLAGALVLVVHGQPRAQTPDGETPAEESVCDDFSGAAWGLCNAYCEAMDCDGDPRASASACDRVAAQFDSKSGGAVLPCEGCPCDFSPAGLLAANIGDGSGTELCSDQITGAGSRLAVDEVEEGGFVQVEDRSGVGLGWFCQREGQVVSEIFEFVDVLDPEGDPRFLSCREALLQTAACTP